MPLRPQAGTQPNWLAKSSITYAMGNKNSITRDSMLANIKILEYITNNL